MASPEGSFAQNVNGSYQDLPAFSTVTIESKVRSHVRLHTSKTRWGTLGPDRNPAAIVFVDIWIEQNPFAIYESAAIELSLEQYASDQEGDTRPRVSPKLQTHVLEFTDCYGPRVLTRELTHILRLGGQKDAAAPWLAVMRAPANDADSEENPFPFILNAGITVKQAAATHWRQQPFLDQVRSVKQMLLHEEYANSILVFPPKTLDVSHPLDDIAHALSANMGQQILIRIPASLEPPLSCSTPILVSIAARGKLELVEKVLREAIGELDIMDASGRTALSWAAGNCHLEIAKVLLEASAKPDKGDMEDRTPLSWAAGNGHEKVVELSGRTPLSYASAFGHRDVVKLFLNRAPSLDIADDEDWTPLAWAASEGRKEVVLTFLDHYKRAEHIEGLPINDLVTKPLSLAAQNSHLSIMRILLESGYQASQRKESWLATQFHYAMQDGTLDLVNMLLQYGAGVNIKAKTPERPPICTAAESGHAIIVSFLLDHGARLEDQTAEGETPLFLAAKNGRPEAVKGVMEVAVEDSTILRMVSEKHKDGKLAENDPYPEISQRFRGKIVFFTKSSAGDKLTPKTKDVLVSELLASPATIQAPEHEQLRFKWLHLPMNNMRWIEALVFAHYGSRPSAYKVLKSDRWVGRQYQRDGSAHQTRFMQPLCQGFGPVGVPPSAEDGKDRGDKDMVCFLPYLHWEENSQLDTTRSVIEKASKKTEDSGLTSEKGLLRMYQFKDESDALHLPHLRRTLDQFGYYTLGDTEQRDKDQTVTRYQQEFKRKPRVTAMVDQAWLWVLVGPSGRADTVISCFPTIERTQAKDGADPDCVTDVLQNDMLYMFDNPMAVKTAYDLAGVIAGSCSRIFLRPSRAPDSLRFTAIYQRAISTIVNTETELFDAFHAMTESRRKDPDPVDEILGVLKKIKPRGFIAQKEVDGLDIKRLAKKNYDDRTSPDIPDADDIASFLSQSNVDANKTREVLQKLGMLHVLDISREIALLREIKDIQDELNIMSMVFEDQKNVLKEMERIVRSMEKPKDSSARMWKDVVEKISGRRDQNSFEAPDSDVAEESRTGASEESDDTPTIAGKNSDVDNRSQIDDPPTHSHEDVTAALGATDKGRQQIPAVNSDDDAGVHIKIPDFHRQFIAEDQPASETWGRNQDGEQSSLALRTVQLSIDDIDRMIQCATKANQALDFLVDLKQKQSNVLDARSARIQAEESLKMTKELPLSFMAAFFALNITQFQRNDGGTLGLGYVLGIMLPVSAAVSFSFIYLAFKADSLERTVASAGRLSELVKRKYRPERTADTV
ncbi:hypothetical protein BJY04DRAFT_224908 [Aspergillus karnatakaensis]|uniref:ankyrin repeat domain-containing protein n=1 Tax=Aspergillus karnatakaensis TaxID=1810916 RepID=UPI003CCD2186